MRVLDVASGPVMAIAVLPGQLLQVPPGYSVQNSRVYHQLDPAVLSHVQIDAFEWFDVRGLGVGGTKQGVDSALARLQTQIQNMGSQLFAMKLLKKTEVNINVLGLELARVDRYRLVIAHSQWQLLGWAAVILGS